MWSKILNIFIEISIKFDLQNIFYIVFLMEKGHFKDSDIQSITLNYTKLSTINYILI